MSIRDRVAAPTRAPGGTTPTIAAVRERRRAGAEGWAFTALLLVSAGMVTVPGGDDPVEAVRAFYQRHLAVVVVSQLIGLVAAAVFVLFAVALRRSAPLDGRAPWLAPAGAVVGLAAGCTAVPVLWLAAATRGGSAGMVHGLARASDLTDVLLFAAIAVFSGVLARAAVGWVRILAGVVGVVSVARAALLLAGSSALELLAPLAFLVLVGAVSTACLRGRSPLRATES